MQKLILLIVFYVLGITAFAQVPPKYISMGQNETPKNYYQKEEDAAARKDSIIKAKRDKQNRQKAIDIGAGGLITSLNFFKNAQTFTYYPASSFRLYAQPNSFIQFLVDYSHVQQVNILPTWLNVQNTYIDLDAHFMLHPANADRTTVYFILGASSQIWKGFYTGIDNYNYYALHVLPNTSYKTVYYGGSIGIGFEFKIINRLNLYGEVRYRITQTDVGFGLSDVCYGAGVKYTLFDFHPKPIYNKPSKHFHWF
jgi:hypothetical protein